MSIGLTSSLFCTTTNHVRIHQLSEATRPALGSLFRTLSWHDELSAKELELGRDLTSLPLKSMPKTCQNAGTVYAHLLVAWSRRFLCVSNHVTRSVTYTLMLGLPDRDIRITKKIAKYACNFLDKQSILPEN
jgi:hypothetical protein